MINQKAAIEKLKVTDQQLKETARRFVEGKGLANLPSYFFIDSGFKEGEYLVLEMGGSSLRTVEACLQMESEGGKKRAEVVYKSKVIEKETPCKKKVCSLKDFYECLFSLIEPFLADGVKIGFAFSFPMKKVVRREGKRNLKVDGRLLYWKKGVKAPQLKGSLVGEEFEKALKSRGYKDCRVTVLNDAEAALLSGLAGREKGQGLMSLVVGTGLNLAAAPENEIINTEAGGLDITGLNLTTEYDEEVDRKSARPGKNRLEQLISGNYIPQIYNAMTKSNAKSALEVNSLMRAGDRTAEAIFRRSARLAGAITAGAASLYEEKEIKVVSEGSVFWQADGYRKEVEKAVSDCLKGRKRVFFERVDNSGLTGAVFAAGMRVDIIDKCHLGLR